ncbi:MAG: YbaB/EbfC family nucleoid-associated protein [Geminicoccus sp.]|jgi:nucleoid-associated protein EbfC|nr:YbaB/EbfC family nucleoid-associated protein [Geminicoccus sp.]
MKNLGSMMKQAQAMQAKMAEAQAKLEQMTVEGASGGGMVKVILSGKGEMKGVTIDPALIDPDDAEVLEDLIVAAHNDAKAKSEEMMAEEMKAVTGGLQLPPGMKMPF